jgi:glycosyltransferase involved in cell wall biosynthesis
MFPRLLFVTPCAFNHVTGTGITFTNLFQGWPRDQIATVTGDAVPTSDDVCNQYFRLSSAELPYFRPLSWVPRRSERPPTAEPSEATTPRRFPIGRLARKLTGSAGIPDRGRLTPRLRAWIDDFHPDLVFSILGTLGYIDLVDRIHKEFGTPIAVHLMDDGVTDPNRSGLFGGYLRHAYGRRFRALLKKTASRMAICPAMANEYERRWDLPFQHFQNTVDIDAWKPYARIGASIRKTPVMVYSGSILAESQWSSLVDLCRVVADLNRQGNPLQFDIYTPRELLGLDGRQLELDPAIRVRDALIDDHQFRETLSQADLLALPVNFDAPSVQFIRLSMPTKVPAYLASGTPILAYGPQGVAQIDYARSHGWGNVVDERKPERLQQAIRRMIDDQSLRERLSQTARQTAREHHDASRVRFAFQQELTRHAQSTRAAA